MLVGQALVWHTRGTFLVATGRSHLSPALARVLLLFMFSTPIRRLRLVGVLEGISYLVLLGIAMPLKYFAGYPQAVEVTGAIHGGLFVLFLLFVVEVMFRRRWWSLGFVAVSLVASVVPCGTFVYDAWLKRFDDTPAASELGEAA